MKREFEIITPENVVISHELAGIGSRFIAFALDTFFQTIILGILSTIQIFNLDIGLDSITNSSGSSLVTVAIIILLFIVLFGYHIILELAMNGRTLGKRIVGIRVIQSTGQPIQFMGSMLRNLLRIGDMLPFFYTTGVLFMVFSKKYTRIGDLAANTVVIKDIKVKRPVPLGYNESSNTNNEGTWEFRVTTKEYNILNEFIKRVDEGSLGDKRTALEQSLSDYFIRKFDFDITIHQDRFTFLKTILHNNTKKNTLQHTNILP